MSERALAAVPPSLFTPAFTSLLVSQVGFGYAFSSYWMLPKFLVTELGAGPAEIGRVIAVHGVAVVVAMPAVGAAVDRFGRRNFLTAGGVAMALTSVAFTAVDSMGPLLYVLRALQGVAFAMAFAAGAALAVDAAPAERVGEAIGLFGLTFLSMNALAPLSVETIASRAGWPAAFASAALGATLCVALSRRLRDGDAVRDAGGRVPGLWEVARRPRLLRLALVIGLVAMGLSAAFSFHQPFALQLGMTRVRDFLVAYALAAVAVRLLLGRFADRVGRRRVSIAALVPYTFVVAGMAQLRPGGLAWFGAGLGVTHGLLYPALNAVAVEGVGVRERGKVMALFQAAFQTGVAFGAFALGLVAEHAGYPAAFRTAGACVLLALLLLAASPDGRR